MKSAGYRLSVACGEKRSYLNAVDDVIRRHTDKWFAEFYDEFCAFLYSYIYIYIAFSKTSMLVVRSLSKHCLIISIYLLPSTFWFVQIHEASTGQCNINFQYASVSLGLYQ